MRKVLIFGNSGSGKSTLAQELKDSVGLVHLDLDALAWVKADPPQRAPLAESCATIGQFMEDNEAWVIEGCYSDSLEYVATEATELIFLNPPIEQCIDNARNREWEPHKYASKAAQDENLEMLLAWLRDYESRDDVFSLSAHLQLYNSFKGRKVMYTSNNRDAQ